MLVNRHFAALGRSQVKFVPNKCCGFVQFVHRADAARAIDRMQGFKILDATIRVCWRESNPTRAAQAAQAEQAARMATATAANAAQHMTSDHGLQQLRNIGHDVAAAATSLMADENVLPQAANARAMPSFRGHSQQQKAAMPPSRPLPHPSRGYAPGFGPSGSACYGGNSAHTTTTDSSWGSSRVRFSGIPGSSGRSTVLFESSSSHQWAHLQSQDSSAMKTSPLHEEQGRAWVHMSDDTGGWARPASGWHARETESG